MSTTVFKLKKSSVPGRIPDSSDLAYGELAINYADGRLYYKNSSNEVKNFIDSDLLQAKYLDSADVTTLVDSAYVQARQVDIFRDSNFITNIIDSDYISTRVTTTTVGTAGIVNNNVFTGDSSTTDFTLSTQPPSEANLVVTINGIVQHANSYSFTGTTLSLDSAPITGDEIEARVHDQFTANISLRDYQTYVYQPSTSTSTFTGNDINANSLTYDAGKLEVYVNGTRLVDTLDYTATTGSSVVLQSAIDSGDTLEIVSLAAAAVVETAFKANDTNLDSAGADQVVDIFGKATYRTVKYVAQIEHDSSSSYHAEEILLTHNGTTVAMTTYGQIYLDSSLGTFDADIVGDNVRLLFSPTKTNTSTKLRRIQVDA